MSHHRDRLSMPMTNRTPVRPATAPATGRVRQHRAIVCEGA